MGLAKRIGKSEALRGLLCWLGSLYIRVVYLTGRWEVVNGAHADALWDQGKPFILAFWHGRILMMPKSWRSSVPIHMLISQHRDGQLIARTVSHFGIHTVAGSTTRGGSAALRAMLKFLKGGQCVGITPDGPKGPRMRASAGIVNVAKLAGVPILPATFSTSRRRVLGSWDRFALALPFSRGVFVWGDPILVPRESDETALDSLRLKVEASLNAITRGADSRMGLETPDPAPEAAEEAA
ncbi:MAG: lysophospholipid acyltransferase family protein [Magnetospirillum sp.]|nr:lysophospholipid acyltransferase family protein [Magnetospirillum sp.]